MSTAVSLKSSGSSLLVILTSVILFMTAFPGHAQSWQQAYNSALQAYNDGDYQAAHSFGEKALSSAASMDEKLYTLKLLSATCNESGNFAQGLNYGAEEINICKSNNVPDSVYVNSLNTYVNNYLGMGNYAEALPYQNELVEISTKIYPANDLGLNQYKSDLGYSLLMLERLDEAIQLLADASNQLAGIDGGAEDFLYNQLSIGQAYYKKGEQLSAMSTLQNLKEILESNGLDGYQIYAEANENLGLVQYTMANFTGAQASFELASSKYTALGFTSEDLKMLNDQLAVVYTKNNELDKADSLAAMYGKEAINENLMINQIIQAYNRYAAGEYIQAKQIVQKVLEQLNDESDKELLAESLMLMTRIDFGLGVEVSADDITRSIGLFEQFGSKGKQAEAMLVKAKVEQSNGNYEIAVQDLEESRKISNELTEEYYLKYSIYTDLLDIYIQGRQLTEADRVYKQVQSVQALEGSEFNSKLPVTYAILLQVAGYNLQARDVLEDAINGTNYPELLSYQRALAKVYLDLGMARESLALYQKIDTYYSEKGENKSADYGENLAQMGRVNVILGDYGKAEGFYANGIKILEANQDSPSSTFASIYNSYAIFQQTIGNFDRAKLFYSKARFFSKDNLALQIDIIQNLATLSQYEKAYEDAILLYKEALPAYATLYGKNHPYYATALQNLANAYSKNGDPLKGIELIEQALEIDRSNGLDVSISYTNKLHNLAILLQETDNLDRSKSILTTVLTNRRNLLGENHPDYIYSLYNMAVLDQKMADYESSKKYFLETIAKYDFQIESFFPYLSEQEKSKYYTKIKEAFIAFQDFAAEYSRIDPSINGDLLNFQLNHKAILLKSSKSIKKAIELSNDQALLALYEEWVALKTSLAKYYSMSQSELDLAGISIDDVSAEANELEKTLSLKSELFESNLQGGTADWRTIQAKLQDREAAIEIIRIKKNIRNDSIWYAALITKPGVVNPDLVVLENGGDLEDRYIRLYKNSIRFKRKDTQSYKAFWKDIGDHLTDTDKIYVSSDGVFNKLNISTLLDTESDEYVLQKLVVHNMTNTVDLINENPATAIDETFSFNLLGNPDFTKKSNDDFEISQLPGTKIELETIDSLASAKNISPVMLTEENASEENIKMITSPGILHVATHGFFLPDNTASEDMYSLENNPLMRSGLLLTGSQQSYRGDHIQFEGNLDSEDGILTAYEAMNLDLTNSELVVLSACETGLGEIKNGEGVYGLQRAFIIAGAKSILISLWKVDDTSTKELMILFYQNILDGVDKFEALNMAQKELREKYDVPYYWGAFVLSGI